MEPPEQMRCHTFVVAIPPLQYRVPMQKMLERELRFKTRQGRANAKMDTEAKGMVMTFFSGQQKFVCAVIDRTISVGRPHNDMNDLALFQCLSMKSR